MIAFFGTGMLGSGFTRAWRKRGEQVAVWNRTHDKAVALEAFGAKAFEDPAEAARGASRVHLSLSDDAETVRKKVMSMYTDPKRIRADVPGTVEGNPVFTYHDAFNPNVDEVEDLKTRYRAGKVGDVEVKTKLAKALNTYLEPIRARRADVLAKPGTLREILHEGSRKARTLAQETMARVRSAVKLEYR